MTRLEVGVTFRLRLPQQQKMLGYEDPHLHDPHGYRRESGENGALKQQEINFIRVENNITKFSKSCQIKYSQLLNVTTKRKEPHACTIGWNIDSNKPHASPGLYSHNAFIVIKASPISSLKPHSVLNKPRTPLYGHYIGLNKPSVREQSIGCCISQSRVLVFTYLAPMFDCWLLPCSHACCF